MIFSIESFVRPSNIKMKIMFHYQSPKMTNATELIQDDNYELHQFNLGVTKSTIHI